MVFTLVSLGLGVVANLVQKKGSFLEKYFLGNRVAGAFAVALTAAVMSGGTFGGDSVARLSFGWVVGLWIASYMIAPLTVLGPGQAGGATVAKDGCDHLARPVPRAVREPCPWPAHERARDGLPEHEPRRPVHGRHRGS